MSPEVHWLLDGQCTHQFTHISGNIKELKSAEHGVPLLLRHKIGRTATLPPPSQMEEKILRLSGVHQSRCPRSTPAIGRRPRLHPNAPFYCLFESNGAVSRVSTHTHHSFDSARSVECVYVAHFSLSLDLLLHWKS